MSNFYERTNSGDIEDKTGNVSTSVETEENHQHLSTNAGDSIRGGQD